MSTALLHTTIICAVQGAPREFSVCGSSLWLIILGWQRSQSKQKQSILDLIDYRL